MFKATSCVMPYFSSGCKCRSLSAVSSALIKELRSRSGAPITAVKNALVAENGDLEAAFDHLRRMGAKLASARANRSVSEGLVGLSRNLSSGSVAMVELNCETDFVSRTALFHELLSSLLTTARKIPSKWNKTGAQSVEIEKEDMLGMDDNDLKLADAATALGENIRIGKVSVMMGDTVGAYIHGKVPRPADIDGDFDAGRIGVAIALSGSGEALVKTANQLAMHIAAEAPLFLRRDLIPKNILDKEKRLLAEMSASEGSKPNSTPLPPEILQKKTEGRLNKWLAEVVLEEQVMLLDSGDNAPRGRPPSVRSWLKSVEPGCEIASFSRISV